MRRLLRIFATLNERLCNLARDTAGLLLVAMVVIVLLQIFFRYVLNNSLIWTEELSKTLMVWTALLVAPWAYRHGANVRIEMFVDELSNKAQRILTLGLNLLVFWIVAVFFSESIGFVERGLTVRTDSLPIQVAWFYGIVPIAFALMLLVSVETLLRNVLALRHPNENFDVATAGDMFQAE